MIKLEDSSQWKLNKLLTKNTSIPTIEEVNYYMGNVAGIPITSPYTKYIQGHKVGITVDIDNITAASMTRQIRLNFEASQVSASSTHPGNQQQSNTSLSTSKNHFVLELFSRYGNYTVDKLYGYYIWLSNGINVTIFNEADKAEVTDLNGSLCFVNGGFDSKFPNRVFISILVPAFLYKLPSLF